MSTRASIDKFLPSGSNAASLRTPALGARTLSMDDSHADIVSYVKEVDPDGYARLGGRPSPHLILDRYMPPSAERRDDLEGQVVRLRGLITDDPRPRSDRRAMNPFNVSDQVMELHELELIVAICKLDGNGKFTYTVDEPKAVIYTEQPLGGGRKSTFYSALFPCLLPKNPFCAISYIKEFGGDRLRALSVWLATNYRPPYLKT